MVSKILDILFGKTPDIFDANGNVVHKLPEERWKSWRERFEKNGDFNWRQHRGTERTVRKPQN
ncbi:MAG: hypothetical protein KF799_11450 [Bdellovibrionales bacterium]|nr:hypothetical protein [Bdellovibrionales bacterium]